jgi:hypothetical protein
VRHRIFTLASLKSLFVCVAALVLWVRSFGRCDYVARLADNDDSSADYVRNIVLGGARGALTITERLALRSTFLGERSGPVHVVYQFGAGAPRGAYPTVDLDALPDFQGLPERTMAAHFAGFAFVLRDQSEPGLGFRERNVVIIAPLPMLVVLAALLPAVWLYRRFNRRPAGQLFCVACAYNLTGNTSGVCPECGTKINSRGH